MKIGHAWPKLLCFVVGVLFVPTSSAEMLSFMYVGVAACLLLHHFVPNRYRVNLDYQDYGVITTNLLSTGLVAWAFVRFAGDGITSSPSRWGFELLYIPVWAMSQEFLFFYIHRFTHTRMVYNLCHKMHHKYRVTDAWSSFVSHPLDHAVSVLGTAFLLPVLMLRLGMTFSAHAITVFLYGSIVTFIGSHHTIVDGKGDPVGTPHLEHHLLSRRNFGNFGVFDVFYGTWVESGDTARRQHQRATQKRGRRSSLAAAAAMGGGDEQETFADE